MASIRVLQGFSSVSEESQSGFYKGVSKEQRTFKKEPQYVAGFLLSTVKTP